MHNHPMRQRRFASAFASMSLASFIYVLPAQAIELDFEHPSISGRLDTNISLGALWRTESRAADLAANGDVIDMTLKGYGTQINRNDANNNFDRGLASLVAKITPELFLDFGYNYGAKVSATAFHDFYLMNENRDMSTRNPYVNNSNNDRFTRTTEKKAGQRSRLLDAYVWGNFEVADRPLTVRLGRQVINWGEALFMQNGINTANYIELASLRRPGAEIKEALLPLASLHFSYEITPNLNTEAFYQFEWKHTEDAPVGSYYSTHDSYPAFGGESVIVDGRVVGAKAAQQAVANAIENGITDPALLQQLANGTSAAIESGFGAYTGSSTQVNFRRVSDKKASSQGQFGLSARYFADSLGGTEFGFYYTRTHAKLPVVAAYMNQLKATGNPGLDIAEMIDNAHYSMAYPEDIDMFGISFSSNVGPVALSGEVAYRPKQPIINDVGDNLVVGLVGAASEAAQGQAPTVGSITDHCARLKLGGSCLDSSYELKEGEMLYFYDEAKMTNASLVSIYNFGPTLGTDDLMFVLELGAEHAGGLDKKLKYASTAAMLKDEDDYHNGKDSYKSYLDRFSWGYRAVLRASYNDVFAGVGFNPSLTFAHDVEGNSVIGGNFMEHRKAATLGLNFVYLNNLTVGAQYTSFWGAGYSNKLRDRDNASLSMSYSF